LRQNCNFKNSEANKKIRPCLVLSTATWIVLGFWEIFSLLVPLFNLFPSFLFSFSLFLLLISFDASPLFLLFLFSFFLFFVSSSLSPLTPFPFSFYFSFLFSFSLFLLFISFSVLPSRAPQIEWERTNLRERADPWLRERDAKIRRRRRREEYGFSAMGFQ
jgi:hypothetical protein